MLENIEISEQHFSRKKGITTIVHVMVLDNLEKMWNNLRYPVMDERAFQIDFIRRTYARDGKVELAVEVDLGFKRIKNWVKLLDVKSPNKFWIFLCKYPNKADEHLNNAIKEFRKLANMRGETKENNVIIFMKTVNKKEIKKKYLFE